MSYQGLVLMLSLLAAQPLSSTAFLTAPQLLSSPGPKSLSSPVSQPLGRFAATPLSLRARSPQTLGLSSSTPQLLSKLDPKPAGSLVPLSPHCRFLRGFVSKTAKVAASALLWILWSSAALASSATTTQAPGGVAGLVNFVLHLDKELPLIVSKYGTTTYAILWAIVFAETGLVVTPFLPGDSLLFACGALCGIGSLSLGTTLLVFLTAAIIGDAVNYQIGHYLGPKAFETDTWFLKKKNLKKTEEFYDTYGAKTIVLARFVPIVRTFAPFVAGVGTMDYRKFASFNVIGAIIWTCSFVGAGFFFGNLPAVKHNFTLVVLGIVVVSVLPVIYEIWQGIQEDREEKAAEQRKVEGTEK